MSEEEATSQAVREISAVFEGYLLGMDKIHVPLHDEIKDEFRLTLRSALRSYLAWAAGQLPAKCLDECPEAHSCIRFNDTIDECHASLMKIANGV